MRFHSQHAMLHRAKRGRYAIGHFNFFNIETAQAIMTAAIKLKAPVILSATESAIKYAGLDNIVAIARNWAMHTNIPVSLHLDHGKDIALLHKCIRKGFNSVMIDGSYLDFEDNIRITKELVEYAHHRRVQVEAELGQLKGVEDNVSAEKHVYTDPDNAREFVKRTGVDSLAVAIGTSHGAYKFNGMSKLKYNILDKIRKKTTVPLVLHGASAVPKSLVKMACSHGARMSGACGVSDASLKKAVRLGIQKVNTDTDLRIAWNAAVREFLKKCPKEFDPRKIQAGAIALMSRVVENRIKVLGSAGKARRK